MTNYQTAKVLLLDIVFFLLLLILMDSPGVETRHMGSAGGMFFCVAEIGGFTGPFMMGILVDATGTFMTGALFLAGLCIAMAVLTIFLNFNRQ